MEGACTKKIREIQINIKKKKVSDFNEVTVIKSP